MKARNVPTLLAALLVVLAVIEFVDAPLIDVWAFAVAFAVLFLVAAALIRSGRVLAGGVLGALLALFEVVGFAGWKKDSAADWILSIATLVVSVGVLVVSARLLFLRRAEQNTA